MVKIGNIEVGEFPLLLAPMEDVTDIVFRRICKQHGADVVVTEFISSEGLIRDAKKSLLKLKFDPMEHPIGAQIYGHNIDSMLRAAEIAEQAKPDFIDLNFGCPVRKIANRGAGAALMKNVPLLIEMASAVMRATKLPVTAKTRLGWDEKSQNIEEITEKLQDIGIAAVAIHARTKTQLYKGEADWTLIGKIKENPRIKIPIFGNGDIDSPEKALQAKEKYNVDGIMIGRAAVGNPWIFEEIKYFLAHNQLMNPPSVQVRMEVCRKHFRDAIEDRGEKLALHEMRKHYNSYFKGIPFFKENRIALLTATSVPAVEELFEKISKAHQ